MGRRRSNFVPDETLSKEQPEVKEKLLEEIIDTNKSQDNQDKPVSNKTKKEDNSSIEKKITPEFNVGDIIKIHKDVKFDMLGKRIHDGLRNYNYKILSIRVDGMLIVECLTHCFTLQPKDVDKI